jgi:hypothetical protein
MLMMNSTDLKDDKQQHLHAEGAVGERHALVLVRDLGAGIR